ncbi:Iron-sulfur assembly protein IscA [Rhynchospora pubera]|uniref:Iron-sulfur assembly protein IscA n=1 Tax=Rhynchospora pubera TaxID=906938 RepID=A0AAV8G2Z3_9POAL|nr:Iron-sulfur assembly protein IscA [Rhynchospora pubera]
MALFASGTTSKPLSTYRPPRDSCAQPPSISSSGSRSLRFPIDLTRAKSFSIRASAAASGSIAPAISLSDKALNHLNKMRTEKNQDLCLRIGVKQGGCSGMSYTMELEDRSKAGPDDSLIEYNGFSIVCDPKSLLFVYGMQLDYSDALIGGGFSFQNPNATKTCGCGKSFATNAVDQSKATECNN